MTRRVLLKPADVAELLGVSTGTLSNWRISGKGPQYLKVGGVRYDAALVEKWIESRKRASTSDPGEVTAS